MGDFLHHCDDGVMMMMWKYVDVARCYTNIVQGQANTRPADDVLTRCARQRDVSTPGFYSQYTEYTRMGGMGAITVPSMPMLA